MKKITAILLSVLILAGLLSIGVAAETTVNVKLTGAQQATKGSLYAVTLSVDNAAVGGLQGTINYDSDCFEFTKIEISNSMAAANRVTTSESGNLINADTAGVIKFAVLCDGTSTQLVKLYFNTLDSAAKATADFTLTGVAVSNGEGTAKVTNQTVDITGKNIYTPAISVKGASVKTNGDADIRFEAEISYTGDDIEEVGIIMIPTWLAAGEEIVLDKKYAYNGTDYVAAVAKLTKAQLGDSKAFYGNLLNSANSASRIRTAISARAYIKLTSGAVIYSDNVIDGNNINGGTSSRCCIDVLRGVAEGTNLDDNINTILAKENKQWTLDDYKSVVTALNEYITNN